MWFHYNNLTEVSIQFSYALHESGLMRQILKLWTSSVHVITTVFIILLMAMLPAILSYISQELKSRLLFLAF